MIEKDKVNEALEECADILRGKGIDDCVLLASIDRKIIVKNGEKVAGGLVKGNGARLLALTASTNEIVKDLLIEAVYLLESGKVKGLDVNDV